MTVPTLATIARAVGCVALVLPTAASAVSWTALSRPTDDNVEHYYLGETLYAGSTSGLVYATLDHGESWLEVAGGLEPEYAPVTSMVQIGDTFVMSRSFSTTGLLNLRSTRTGGAWGGWEALPDQSRAYRTLVAIGTTLVATHDNGSMSTSTDGGTSWAPIALPAGVGAYAVQAVDGALWFAAGTTLYRSTDVGATWEPWTLPAEVPALQAFGFHDGEVVVSGTHGGGQGSLWRTTDGASWAEITTLPSSYHANGMTTLGDGRFAVGVASGSDGGSVFASSDLVTWTDLTGDLPWFAVPVLDLFAHDGYIFKTGGSVTHYRTPESGIVATPPDVSDLAPLGVYPNPLRARAAITVPAGGDGTLRIDVFDTTGRRVDTVFEGPAPLKEQTYAWDASSVTSGVYYLVGRVGDRIVNRAAVRVVR